MNVLYISDYSAGHVPYVAMRAQGALLGTLLVPIAFFTLRFGGHSIYASAFAALAVCYGMHKTNNEYPSFIHWHTLYRKQLGDQ